MLRSDSGRHTAATRMPTRTSLDRRVEHLLELQHPPGPSSAIDTRAKGSVSSWPGYCTGVTTVKLTTVPVSPSSTSSSVGELDHVDGAEVLRRHVDEAALAGALLPDDLAVEQRLGVAGERGRGGRLVVQRHRERHDPRPFLGRGVGAHVTTSKHSMSVT